VNVLHGQQLVNHMYTFMSSKIYTSRKSMLGDDSKKAIPRPSGLERKALSRNLNRVHLSAEEHELRSM
jgi:hypothetical protein